MSGLTGTRSNIVTGACLGAGGLLLAVASTHPWLRLHVTGLPLSSRTLQDIIRISLTPTYAPGVEGETRILLLALAAVIGGLGLALIATTSPYLGLLWRFGAAVAALLPVVTCAHVWQASTWNLGQAVTDPASAAPTASASAVFAISPAPVLWLMTVGLALAAVGIALPPRRNVSSPTNPLPSPAPSPGSPTVRLPPLGGLPPGPLDDAVPARYLPWHALRLDPYRLLTPPQWGAAIGSVALLGVVVWALATAGPRTSVSFGGLGSGGPAATPAQRACITATESSNRTLFEQAATNWQRQSGPFTFDGVPAYRDYAEAVAALDLTACPADYALTYQNWGRIWQGYGTYLEEMARPHLPWHEEWSSDSVAARLAAFDRQVKAAYAAISTAAQRSGVPLKRTPNWTPATS